MPNSVATEEDRKHFCTYAEAIAAIPDDLPFKSNGHRHVAVNLSTGHRIPCADAYMAAGYVAGSGALFKQWAFVLEMGQEQVQVAANPKFKQRIATENWQAQEQWEAERRTARLRLEERARAAHDNVMSHGGSGLGDEDEVY